MVSIDRIAMAWTIGIVAVFIGIASVGDSLQSTGIESPQALVRPVTIETPSYEETKPTVDPFADIAEEVKQKASMP